MVAFMVAYALVYVCWVSNHLPPQQPVEGLACALLRHGAAAGHAQLVQGVPSAHLQLAVHCCVFLWRRG